MEMDDDLEKILDDMWEKKPQPTYKYCEVKSTLMLVQEIRNLNKIIWRK